MKKMRYPELNDYQMVFQKNIEIKEQLSYRLGPKRHVVDTHTNCKVLFKNFNMNNDSHVI